jgi:hypothetical protein
VRRYRIVVKQTAHFERTAPIQIRLKENVRNNKILNAINRPYADLLS